MKKEESCSVFMTTLMIAIPIGAVVAILLEIFIPIGFGVIDYIAEVSTKHGSTIAGLLGILGVFILVRNQNKTTKNLIKNSFDVLREERFLIDRGNARLSILRAKKDLNHSNHIFNRGKFVWNSDVTNSDQYIKNIQLYILCLKDINISIEQIHIFFSQHSIHKDYVKPLYLIAFFENYLNVAYEILVYGSAGDERDKPAVNLDCYADYYADKIRSEIDQIIELYPELHKSKEELINAISLAAFPYILSLSDALREISNWLLDELIQELDR